jgi:hypothetical protein
MSTFPGNMEPQPHIYPVNAGHWFTAANCTDESLMKLHHFSQCRFLLALAAMTVSFDNAHAGSSVSQPPFMETGLLVGRDGAAFGPGVIVQFNYWRLGLYGFGGTSSVSGYQAGDGISADFYDRTLGFGVQGKITRIGKFTFGGFGQAAYYGSHVQATYFDPVYAMKEVEYRESVRDPLVSIGPEIDYEPVRGIRIAVRPGKNFGDNFAANTAYGFSINGGVLFDTERTGRTIGLGIASGIKKLFH